MKGRTETLINKALDAAVLVARKCGRQGNVLKSYRARARQGASDIAFHGLPFTIAVIASRSSASSLEEALRGVGLEAFIERLCNDNDYARRLGVAKPEEKGYAIYGFTLLHILRSLGVIRQSDFQEFMKNEAGDPIVGQAALQAAVWMKRFAEAYIHEESRA